VGRLSPSTSLKVSFLRVLNEFNFQSYSWKSDKNLLGVTMNSHVLTLSKLNKPAELREFLRVRPHHVNAVDADGCTSLMIASSYGFVDCLKILLAVGAKKNSRDCLGRTALFLASSWGCSQSIELLLRHGADYSISDDVKGLLPLSSECLSQWCKTPMINSEKIRLQNFPSMLMARRESWYRRKGLLQFAYQSGFLSKFKFYEDEEEDGNIKEKEDEEKLAGAGEGGKEVRGEEEDKEEINECDDQVRIEELLRIIFNSSSLRGRIFRLL